MLVRQINDSISEIAVLFTAMDQSVLQQFQLTPSTFAVLRCLESTPELRQVDLAALVHVDTSTITRSIDRLEQAGLVRRSTAPDDRRAILVQLLPSGYERLHHALHALDLSLTQRLGSLEDPEQQLLLTLLTKLQQLLRADHICRR